MDLERRDAIERFYPIGVGPCKALIDGSLFQQMRFERHYSYLTGSKTVFDDLLKKEHALEHLHRYGGEYYVLYVEVLCRAYIDRFRKAN